MKRGEYDTFLGMALQGYVLKMLKFIDKWILNKAGSPDYFFQSRKMSVPAEGDILFEGKDRGHRPFANIHDYFYNIRLRTDRFLSGVKLLDLLEPIPGTGVRIIDCVFEAHNLSIHYLVCLKSAMAGEVDRSSPFLHTNPCFEV